MGEIQSLVPAQFTRDDLSRWEQKGRGLAVFRCPDAFSMPDIESLAGTSVLRDPDADQEIPGEPARVVLKLSSRYTPHLNNLVNLIVLPAYRRSIPLYLFTPWDQRDLETGSVAMPVKDRIEESMVPLLGEQLRTLLACTCVVFSSPGALVSTEKPWLTPVERIMFDVLTESGLSCRPHVQIGASFVDALVEDQHGNRVAVEIDGREFTREGQHGRDEVLSGKYDVQDTVRFSGSEVTSDPNGCVERAFSVLAGREHGTAVPISDPKPDLAEEQARCLSPRAGVVLTLAPAGSGKTRVLTRRVVEAVRGGVKAGRILCVVFNKSASEVMSERIHGDAGLPDVHIRTLHSLGYEICRQAPNSPYVGYGVITERSLPGGLTELFRQALRKDLEQQKPAIPFPFPEHLVTAYEESVSRGRRTLIPIDKNYASEEIEGYDTRQIRRIATEVECRMDEKSLMTFDEQLYRAVEVLLTCPAARSIYQHRFDSVLVDEVQDLTPVQFLMLRLLSLPLNNLFAVGDDDQMINTFTGADPENIRSFQRWYPGAVVHTLGENYRCRPEIVNRSASVISHNLDRFEKPIRPVQTADSSRKDTIRVHKCPSLAAETDTVVRTIHRWRKSGYDYGDMAVLVRVQSIASPLQSALKAAALPFNPLDGGALYQSHAGRTVGAYLDVIVRAERADPLSYAVSLSFPSRQFTNIMLRDVAMDGHAIFERMDSLPGDVVTKLEDYRCCIETLRSIHWSRDTSPVEFFEALLLHSGLGDFYHRRDETSRQRMAAADKESLDTIRRMAAGYSSTGSFADSYLRSMASDEDAQPEDTARDGADQEDRVHDDAQKDDIAPKDPERDDRITVTTIHQSKGDEFKGVVLFHVVEDILPHRRMTGSDEDIEEERRVFYVALTRAEERLCITTQRKQPSRFLAEMKQKPGGNRLSRYRKKCSMPAVVERCRRILLRSTRGIHRPRRETVR